MNLLHAILQEQEIRDLIGLPPAGNRTIQGLAPLGAADDNCLYFVNGKLTSEIRDSFKKRRGCIVIARKGSCVDGELGDCVVLEAPDSRAAFAKVLGFVQAAKRQPPCVVGRRISVNAVISPMAIVEGDVEIADDVVIEPFCIVGPEVSIARGTVIKSGTRVFPRVVIGENCAIGENSIIGHTGFGFVRDDAGNKTRMTHLGGVRIGSHVEIGVLTTVLSGTIVPTVVEDHVKVDDHVHIGHNVRIERGASVTAGVIIGGHSVIGEEAWVGINSSIRDGRRVGDYSLVGMDSSVQTDIEDDSVARAPRPDVRTRPPGSRDAIGFTQD